MMHPEIVAAVLFSSGQSWVWLATYAFLTASAYSAYSLGTGKFMAPRLTFFLICSGFAAQTVFLFIRGHEIGRCPITNSFELLVFLGWSMILIYLAIGSSYRLSLLGAFSAPFVSLTNLWALLLPESGRPIAVGKVNPWLEAHTSFSIVACGAFALAGLAGLVYLLQEHQLKGRRPNSIFFRLPPIRTLSEANSRLLWLGFGLFTIGLSCGFLAGPSTSWYKVSASLAIWALYGGLSLARLRHSVAATWIARLSIVGFSLLLGVFWFVAERSEVR